MSPCPVYYKAQATAPCFVGKAHFGPVGSEGEDPLNLGFDVNIGGAAWGQPKSYYGQDHYGNHPKYGEKVTHQVPHLEAYFDTDTFLTEALTLGSQQGDIQIELKLKSRSFC